MSTEEDTFRALKRTPFDEVHALVTRSSLNRCLSTLANLVEKINNDTPDETPKILAEHNWTIEEYNKFIIKKMRAK